MSISWYSISIYLPNGGDSLFTGYFKVYNATNVIQNLYYLNNNQYVDVLLSQMGDYGSDNQFINGNFTMKGTTILPVIPYINTNYTNPYKLSLWINGPNNIISYSHHNYFENYPTPNGWTDSPINFTFTFTSISGHPSIVSIPRQVVQIPSTTVYMNNLFTNNAQVYYKPHSLSSGGGGCGVINHRAKQRRT
jgi:hypothetical protein